MKDNPETFEPTTRAEWRAWLHDNVNRIGGIWLVLHKGEGTLLSYEEAVEEAVAFGWIDSKANKLDAQRFKLWVAPRKPGSGWSRINKERIQKLIQTGQMTRAGLDKIEAAKQDGSWNALDAIDALEIPPDLAQALAGTPPAAQNFDTFPRSVKRGILEWISTAKRPETRAKRIEETARLAAENIRANQWRQ